MVNPATFLFASVLMSPTILMRAADDKPERAGTRAVMLCNFAAAVRPFWELWSEGPPSIGRALDILSRLTAVSEAWLAAGFGWLLSEAMIFAAQRWLALEAARELAAIDKELAFLLEEWGEE